MQTLFIPRLKRVDGMSWAWAAVSRIALVLTAALIAVMPLSEYFFHFDRFLRGGQDVELGLLTTATFICLVMVMVQHGKSCVRLTLSLQKWLAVGFHRDDRVAPGTFAGLIGALHAIAVPSPSLGRRTLPLLT